MDDLSIKATHNGRIQILYWLLIILVACLIPLVTNLLLPSLGITVFSKLLGVATFPFIICSSIGLFLYLQYLKFCLKYPLILALYVGVLFWPAIYVGDVLDTIHITFPIRIMHIVFLMIPSLVMLFKNIKPLNEKYHYFKYVILFLLVYSIYYIFYNHNFVEPFIAMRSGASISQVKLHDMLYALISFSVVGCTFLKAKTADEKFKLFRLINKCLIIFTLIQGLLVVFGYPLSLFTQIVDGFKRSTGFTYHPNDFGVLEGTWLLYFIGLYYYYQTLKLKNLRLDQLLLVITIAVNILAFLFSMSKNSIAAFLAGCAVFGIFSLFDARLRKKMLIPLVIIGILIVGCIISYQMNPGNDLLNSFTDRFNDSRSLTWRYSVWNYLMGHLDQGSIWLGHGLTASNIELFRFLFQSGQDSKLQSIFVHNAFINFLYDMGISGLLIFGGFLAVTLDSMKRFFKTKNSLFLVLICITIFSLISGTVDECLTEITTSCLYWFLVTLTYSNFNYTDNSPISIQSAEDSYEPE